MTVGERIIMICADKGITVMSLEQSCGLSSAYIKNIAKKGSIPGAGKLKKIADYLHVPAEYILTGSAPEAAGPVFPVSDEEKQIVLAYRRLLQPQKDLILQMLNIERKRGRSSTSEATA